LVIVRQHGHIRTVVVGPWTTAGVVRYTEGAELLWIKLRLGTFMPHLAASKLLDTETILPEAARHAFRLQGATWQCPDYHNVETLIDRLVRAEVLMHDPIVHATLHNHLPALAPRTLRHRFVRATGLTQSHIRQLQRAQQAAALLHGGVSILDTVYEAGYFDQPHLTRALKHFIGYTPAQLTRMRTPA
jgi:AraC-like DNA-binding protein